jgi:hypothetical protein
MSTPNSELNLIANNPGSTQRPASSGVCKELFKDLQILLNGGNGKYLKDKFDYWIPADPDKGYQVTSIGQRLSDLLYDGNDLYKKRRYGANSYQGHIDALNAQKRAIKDVLTQIKDSCSYDSMTEEQKKIIEEATEAANKPTPTEPDRRIQEIGNKGPGYFIRQGAKEIFDILIKVGTFPIVVILAILAGIAASLGVNFQSNANQLEAQGIPIALLDNEQTNKHSATTSQNMILSTDELLTKAKLAAAGANGRNSQLPEVQDLIAQLSKLEEEYKSNLNQGDSLTGNRNVSAGNSL